MANTIVFSEYNFKLISFRGIFKAIDTALINDLYNYNLLENKKITRDVERLFMHYVIHGICEQILKHAGREKVIVYFCKQDLQRLHILNHYSDSDIVKVVNKIIVKIRKVLPVRVYTNGITFRELTLLSKEASGNRDEAICGIRGYLDSIDFANFTFSKAKIFATKNGLTFLSKEYFNTLKSKQLLIA